MPATSSGGENPVHSHLVLLLVFSIGVSTVLALLGSDDPRTQWRTGALMCGAFVVSALVVGWLMYPFPR